MTIDENTVRDIRFILRRIVDCPAKRRILEAIRKAENTGTATALNENGNSR